MDPTLKDALQQPSVTRVLLEAVDHADITLRRYVWRGFRPEAKTEGEELMVGDKTAADFVQEALKRLCAGTRKFDPSKTLLQNLNSATDSIIWSEKKSSDRSGILDFEESKSAEDLRPHPITTAPSPKPSARDSTIEDELLDAQRKSFQLLRESFDGDAEMQAYLDALNAEYFDTTEISEVTGIPVPKIYELRRKVKVYARKFFGVADYRGLERKIIEGK